ncbi:MAG: (2Fe-2S)-binding protein [Bacillota bacterium]
MTEGYAIELTVNGRQVSAEVRADETLLEFLRTQLRIIDAKSGCGKGDCGTCTVLLDGLPVKSCIVLAASADGKDVKTLSGMQNEPLVKALQESFVTHGAVQCGFCTPGMILTAASYLNEHKNPSRDDIRRALSGNLCRCTGYKKIVDATQAVARRNE